MLHEFLQLNRSEILDLSERKTKALAGTRTGSDQLNLGLPMFYEQLISVLETQLSSSPPMNMLKTAALHGKEFLRLGFSLSHVVHAYGSMCQATTELAINKKAKITSEEFNILNGCLDVAIAAAVSEYQFRSNEQTEDREVKHLGFLAHELRNALSSATIAHEMIKVGLVGTGGSTANVLEANLGRMRNLIDRSLSEVRMRADADIFVESFRLSDLIDQIIITVQVDAKKKNLTITSEADWKIEIQADRQFMLSAIANLIQNAIKYTTSGGKIWVRTTSTDDRVKIEVEDQCGGIDTAKVSEMFKPYTQGNIDKSGLGLGLSIAQKAIQLNQGTIAVKNHPGSGCAFTIDIPKNVLPSPSNKPTVRGEDSIQPDFRKRT